MKPSKHEIDEVINKCSGVENSGESEYPGMTYEEGVKAGIEWVLGEITDHPLN